MPLDLTYDKAELVPEDFRGTEKQVDGKFVVSVVPKSKLDEFRENNIKLVQERDTLNKFKGEAKNLLGTDDLTSFAADFAVMKDAHQKMKDGKLVEQKGLEAAIEERTKEMKAAYEGQLKETGTQKQQMSQELDSYKSKYKKLLIQNEINAALMNDKSGIRPDALPVVLKEAFEVFRVTPEEKIQPYQGDTVIYGPDGATPMTPTEWLKKLGESMPFLLKDSSGGGAGGDRKLPGGIDPSKLSPTQKMNMGRRA